MYILGFLNILCLPQTMQHNFFILAFLHIESILVLF